MKHYSQTVQYIVLHMSLIFHEPLFFHIIIVCYTLSDVLS